MVKEALERALLLSVYLMLSSVARASDSAAVTKYIDMHPHAETTTEAERAFPATQTSLCLGEACSGPSIATASIPPALAGSARPSAATCINSSGLHAAVPYDINGDCTSDLLWMNDETHQFGWWLLYPVPYPKGTITTQASQIISVTPGYWIAATGDFNNDGLADLVWTSNSRDLYLWTSHGSGFDAAYIGTYPAGWTLVGAADIDGDGYDDLIWENQSACEFGYWLMKGTQVVSRTTISVTCGYHIAFIETAFDSPNGTTPAIYWQGQISQSGTAPTYLWLPQGKMLNASFFGYLPGNWAFVAGLLQRNNLGEMAPLTMFDTVAPDTSNTLWWTNNWIVAGGAGQQFLMPGYQVVAAGHFTSSACYCVPNNQEILWANSAGKLVVWTIDTTNPQAEPVIDSYLGSEGYTLPDAPAGAGWHVVRPGLQN
ncbi:VCBS repeat-containing protein [Rhodanobacter sp. 7MK24]|uniref:FG-GAP repeat domain-containing protein n=1 Tax=Rhodanobacter sp. 7MK24 TaxID=2775922 RepID=UPI001782C956|nr:VCBS repeat-containing protein [Rhodanobacter sp. 7MK24]MBD8881983.1 VCBS repeat-containing protein [Rhodanobacter sp. 7MK24]